MRAVVVDPAGSPDYWVIDAPEPVMGAGEALLEMGAATLNYRDHLVRSNPVSPYSGDARGRIAGSDGVGIVQSIGPGVAGIDIGGRYMPSFFPDWLDGGPEAVTVARHLGGSVSGVMAQRMAAVAPSLVAVPEHLTDEEAAALPCAGLTAWASLITYGRARAGQTILIQGTGGVSIMALQIAKLLGLRAFVTSSSDAKLARARELGADEQINYRTTPDWAAAVLDLTSGRGVDHIIDVGGESTTAQSLRAIAMGGHLSLVGVLGGFGLALDGMGLRGRTLHLHSVFVESRAALAELAEFVGTHRMRPVIDATYPMDEVNAAMGRLLEGTHLGKIAVRLGQ